VSSLNPPQGEARPGAIGIRLPWQDMRVMILDADGHYVREAAIGEAGTIAITGPNLFAGYLNASHNKGLWIELPPASGEAPRRWLNTGDLGRMDAQGYFWLTGRSKELIIRGGHNIDPKMIEEPMHEHPAVALAAAVGRPDAHAGEVPTIYVQLRPGATATPQQLLEWAQARIAERAAWPRQVHILPTLPTTAVGKIFKPALIEMEVASVVLEEADQAGMSLRSCEVLRDPQKGLVVRWAAEGDAGALAKRLGRYTFQTERV
jgi:acyl-CoA synthetase (AMP-forming)/AMP-acid ligase II